MPTVLVVDASVLVVALADDGADGDRVRARLRGEHLAAPELIDLEVMSVVRVHSARRQLDTRRALQVIEDLSSLPLLRATHQPLLTRCWELRENVSTYDAAYVALAELLGADLLTADQRLARAVGPRCRIEVIA